MLCAISGVTPEEPVVSTKSGHIFEKRLIQKHLKITGTCPVTKEELAQSDLLEVKTTQPSVKPRPPSATSIPGMLALFQNEWDSVMLETFTLKQHLETVRQELAHALYQHDAACRVIARLVKERDEARAALGQTQGNIAQALAKGPTGAAGSSTPMETEEDDTGISAAVIKKMQMVAKNLSKTRKQQVKDAAASVVKTSDLKNYSAQSTHPLHSASKPGITSLDLHPTDDNLVITGGHDGNAIVFNRSTKKIVDTLKGHKKDVTDVLFHPSEPLVFTASADGTANVWHQSGDKYTAGHSLKAHSGSVVGVTLHPSGSYVVTASEDKSWCFFDVQTGVCRQQVTDAKFAAGYTRVTFHPDGLILGAGTEDSLVRIFDVKAQKNVATFKGHTGKVTGLSFSENGYYLASGDAAGVVKLWDLRKLENFHTLQADDLKSIANLSFDASGSYLGVAGEDLRVYGTKEWELVHSWNDHKKEVTAVKFGKNASFLASASLDRNLKFWG